MCFYGVSTTSFDYYRLMNYIFRVLIFIVPNHHYSILTRAGTLKGLVTEPRQWMGFGSDSWTPSIQKYNMPQSWSHVPYVMSSICYRSLKPSKYSQRQETSNDPLKIWMSTLRVHGQKYVNYGNYGEKGSFPLAFSFRFRTRGLAAGPVIGARC